VRTETERSSCGNRKSERARKSALSESTEALEKATIRRRLEEVPDYDSALARACSCLRSLQPLFDKEQANAHDLVAELLVHPPQRQKLILRNNARFHTWGVYARLLDRSRAQSVQSPADTLHLARLALLVADRLDTSLYQVESIADLRARAWTYIGNTRRQQSNLTGAAKAFRTAEAYLQRGTGDPVELALFLDLKASLLRAQRQFPRAMSLLKRSYTIFLTAGDRHRAGRALVSMEIIHNYAGSPEQGIPLLYQALELIDPQQEPRLLLCIWHNLVSGLAEAGRSMEAHRLFLKARALYPRFPEAVTQNRRTWMAGKIACGLGQEKEAESLFLAARQSFLAEEIPYEVALVSLDLAGLYAKQGRTEEMKRLAVEMMPVFSSLHIHREALAALTFWKQAVEAETSHERISQLVAGVAAFLKRSRYDPELRFVAPV
jgi:tetratricopeptide (TPR) repeat protein